MKAQGERLARWLVINSGFNCLTPRVIVQWSGWPQRESLNRAVGETLGAIPTRRAYYPEAAQRHRRYLSAHPEAGRFGAARNEGHLPWTFITGLDPNNSGDICFRNEPFCGLFSETAIEANNPEQFLDRAVRFANETLWGNLTATLVVHPQSLKDRAMAVALDHAVDSQSPVWHDPAQSVCRSWVHGTDDHLGRLSCNNPTTSSLASA